MSVCPCGTAAAATIFPGIRIVMNILYTAGSIHGDYRAVKLDCLNGKPEDVSFSKNKYRMDHRSFSCFRHNPIWAINSCSNVFCSSGVVPVY